MPAERTKDIAGSASGSHRSHPYRTEWRGQAFFEEDATGELVEIKDAGQIVRSSFYYVVTHADHNIDEGTCGPSELSIMS